MKIKDLLEDEDDHHLLKGVVLVMSLGDDITVEEDLFEGIFAFRKKEDAEKFHERLEEKFDGSDQITELHECEEGLIQPAWIVTWTDSISVGDDVMFYAVAESQKQLEDDFEDDLPQFRYKNKIADHQICYVRLEEDFDFDYGEEE